eukprot:6492757-Amphidinium_carterae.3
MVDHGCARGDNPPAFTPVGAAEQFALHQLWCACLVENRQDGTFALTADTCSSLKPISIFAEPQRVSAAPPLETIKALDNVQELDIYQMVLLLREAGYQWKPMPTGKRQVQLPAIGKHTEPSQLF